MTKSTSITEYMANEDVQRNITNALGARKMAFITSVASLVNANPALKECEFSSILSACLVAASLDFPLNQSLGFAYIIPYNRTITDKSIDPNTGKEKIIKTVVKQAQFQVGWKGFVQLAQRSGRLYRANATDIREGEILEDDLVTGEMIIKKAPEREKLPIVGYLAFIQLDGPNGFSKTLYMTKTELEKHAKRYSASYRMNSKGTNVWRDDFDSMAKKTVIKLLFGKYAPMTSELAKAIEADQSVEENGTLSYIDNEVIDPKQLAHEKEVERVRIHIEKSESIEMLEQCREFVTSENERLFNDKFDVLVQKEEKQLEENQKGSEVDVKDKSGENYKTSKKGTGKARGYDNE